MQQRLSTALVIASIAVTAGGCVTAGRGLDDDIGVKLAPATTTKSDVKTLFGAPQVVNVVSPGQDTCVEEWSYQGKAASKRLTVAFTSTGKICRWDTAADGVVAVTRPGIEPGR
jgi:hypothetical protein